MENMWIKSHQFLLDMSVGDFYLSGGVKHSVIKRTKKKIWFDNGYFVQLTKSKEYGFLYLKGKNVNQILRDIEGYLIYMKLITQSY